LPKQQKRQLSKPGKTIFCSCWNSRDNNYLAGAVTIWSWQNYISQMLKQQDQQLSKPARPQSQMLKQQKQHEKFQEQLRFTKSATMLK